MIQPARSDLVDGGKYTIVVRATDGGKPPLHSDVKVWQPNPVYSGVPGPGGVGS